MKIETYQLNKKLEVKEALYKLEEIMLQLENEMEFKDNE